MTTKDKYKKVAYYPGCALEGTGQPRDHGQIKIPGRPVRGFSNDFLKQSFGNIKFQIIEKLNSF